MKLFPNSKTFLTIGSLSIRWYAVLILTGALVAYYFSYQDIKKRKNINISTFSDMFVYILWTGIIGARLWYCLFYNASAYLTNPINIIRVWDGGLAIQGGIVAGFLFAYYYSKKHKMDFYVLLDCILPNVLIAQSIGRWGNFVNKECHGIEVAESYYDGILSFLKEGMYISGSYYEPSFFYESMLCLLGWAIIHFGLRPSQNKRGDGAYAYFMWYGVVRFFIERNRTDSLMLGNIKMAMLTSVIFLLIGLLGYFGIIDKYLIKKKKPTIIFDMDGTLIDTSPSILKGYEALFKKYDSLDNFTKERRVQVLGPALEGIFKEFFPGKDYKELYEVYAKAQSEATDLNKLYDGTIDTLKSLHEEGYKIAVLSTRTKNVLLELIQENNLQDYFDYVCGLTDVTNVKPDPEGIYQICNQKDFNNMDVILIGDSPADILCGKNYGAYTVGFLSNEDKKQALMDVKANRYIENIQEVLNIVKEDHYFTYNEE